MGILDLIAKKNTAEKEPNLQEIVGKKCVVIETIDNYAGCGQVRVNGQGWAARSAYDEDIFEPGETLNIVAIEGVRLVCVKK